MFLDFLRLDAEDEMVVCKKLPGVAYNCKAQQSGPQRRVYRCSWLYFFVNYPKQSEPTLLLKAERNKKGFRPRWGARGPSQKDLLYPLSRHHDTDYYPKY